VGIPGFGTANPGLAQVTAVGLGPTHCIAFPPARFVADRTVLEVVVHAWFGKTRTRKDTDFILNYDQYMTRASTSHQGARAYANAPIHQSPPVASYTPSRTYNTGAIIDELGTMHTGRESGATVYITVR
jgi:hypothetical protein